MNGFSLARIFSGTAFVLSSGSQEWERTAPRASLIAMVLLWVPLPCAGVILRYPAGLV